MKPEIFTIGGGAIALSIALELQQRGARVAVLSRSFDEAASHAAAGMLAPHAERLTDKPMREFCLQSRLAYSEWVRKIEAASGIDLGYRPCGAIAPILAGDRPIANANGGDEPSSRGLWLDRGALHAHQPGLSSEVSGGWWFAEDGLVDNRALTKALLAAVREGGGDVREGVTVEAIEQHNGRVVGLQTSAGILRGDRYVLAAGAWSQQILPVPVRPVKGQMFSARVPEPNPLHRIIFGEKAYLIPRGNSTILVGATVEDVGFVPGNTPAGLQKLLQAATELYPLLAESAIEEFWWGFRPTTPDELPILGAGPCENLFLATGHHRNGILLAPATATAIADLVLDGKTDPLLSAFSWERFYRIREVGETAMKPVAQYPLPAVLESEAIARADREADRESDRLCIAGRSFHSRLFTGTGKYGSIADMQASVAASGCQIVTVAVRRVQTNAPGHEGLAEAIDWSQIWMLPNTAGCKTAEEAVRVARLGREMAKLLGQKDNNFVKLEVIPETKYLLPDPIGTLQAAEQLVKEGFAVLPYINADPLLAKRLEEAGCATVMPLGSPIGSGRGIQTTANVGIIVENAQVPVVVDAGIGTPSEAAQAMEIGADAVLINTAIARAQKPPQMARAMALAVEAGRMAFLAGRIPARGQASASSPTTGTIA